MAMTHKETFQNATLLCVLHLAISGSSMCAQPRTQTNGQNPVNGLKRIEIVSSAWNGRKIIRQKLVIRAMKMGYMRDNSSVDSDAVAELLARLQSASQPLSLEALGVDRERLLQMRAEAPGICKNQVSPATLDRFSDALTNEAAFLKAARRYYERESSDFVILDDEAELKLAFVRNDGSRITLYSKESRAFMIPWVVITPTLKFETYDTQISHALLRLLPNGFLNSSRIGGKPHGLDFSCEVAAMM